MAVLGADVDDDSSPVVGVDSSGDDGGAAGALEAGVAVIAAAKIAAAKIEANLVARGERVFIGEYPFQGGDLFWTTAFSARGNYVY